MILNGTFFIAALLLAMLIAEALTNLRQPWSRPALVMYGTVGMWYLVDYLYNDPRVYATEFSGEVLDTAFLQVCGFLLTFRLVLSALLSMRPVRLTPNNVQGLPYDRTLQFVALMWAALTVIGLVRIEGDFWSILVPPLSESPAYMWGRPAVGGTLDFLVSSCEYTHIAACGMLGVLAVLARRPNHRLVAAALFLVSIMPYLFQGARHRMLAVLLPPMLTYFWATRASTVRKTVIAAVCFLFIWVWFLMILEYRGWSATGMQGGHFFTSERLSRIDPTAERHYGLNMFEELCHINTLMAAGSYTPNVGENYLAEAVGFVPRTIWPGKPMAGIDYAIARGFGGAGTDHGVFATISTGLIGQGVVNFGPYFGPVAAAALSAIWVTILTHLWTQRRQLQRLLLFMVGLALMPNLGRDISLLVLFPFIFAYVSMWAYETYEATRRQIASPARGG